MARDAQPANLIKITQAQTPAPQSKGHGLDEAKKACEHAAAQGSDLLILPEMFCCPYATENFPRYAEEDGSGMWLQLSQLARNYGIYLAAGSVPERDEAGKVYNTAYVFDRTGTQIAKHRKMHLFDIDVQGGQHFQESETLGAGNSVTTFQTEFGTLGLCICYDVRFPELVRLMALEGARLVIVPAAFNTTTGPLSWELVFRSQAMFNQVFMLGTSPALDENASYHAWGHSIAVDPWGKIIAQLDEAPGYQTLELDLSLTESVRQQLPLLKHRRTDVYSLETCK